MATVDLLTSIYSSHQISLERLSAGLGRDALPFIKNIRDEVDKIFNNLPQRKLTQKQQDAILDEVTKITREQLQDYTKLLRSKHQELGGVEAEFTDTTVKSVVSSQLETTIPSQAQVNTLAISNPIKLSENSFTTYRSLLSTYWSEQTRAIDKLVLFGFKNGETNDEIAKLVLSQMPEFSRKAQAQARMIARTGTSHYATQARLGYEQDNDKVIIGWRSIATLDSSTSQICRSLDQVVMNKKDPRWEFFVTPRHPNERSALVPEIDGRLTYGDEGAERPTNFTVDGEKDPERVSSKSIYYNQMSKLKAADQDAILGPTLGKAFRKLNDPQAFAIMTVDPKTLQPLTIKELIAKDSKLSKIIRDQM